MTTHATTPPADSAAVPPQPFGRRARVLATLVLGGALVGLLNDMMSFGVWRVLDPELWRVEIATEYFVVGWIGVGLGALLGAVAGVLMMTGLQHVSLRQGLTWCLVPVLVFSLQVSLYTRRVEWGWAVAALVFLVTAAQLDTHGRAGGRASHGLGAFLRRGLRFIPQMLAVAVVALCLMDCVVSYRLFVAHLSDVWRGMRELRGVAVVAAAHGDDASFGWDQARLEAVLKDREREASGRVLLAAGHGGREMLLYMEPRKPWETNAAAALAARGSRSLVDFVYDPTNGITSRGVLGLYHSAE